MHAFIRGKDVGFSAGRFYGGVADLLAGVEEEEGYVVDGRWVGWEGKEERRKKTTGSTDEAAIDEAVNSDAIRPTASDKERKRMEEILQSPSSTSSQSSSRPCSEEGVRAYGEVQTRRHSPAASESSEDSPDGGMPTKGTEK